MKELRWIWTHFFELLEVQLCALPWLDWTPLIFSLSTFCLLSILVYRWLEQRYWFPIMCRRLGLLEQQPGHFEGEFKGTSIRVQRVLQPGRGQAAWSVLSCFPTGLPADLQILQNRHRSSSKRGLPLADPVMEKTLSLYSEDTEAAYGLIADERLRRSMLDLFGIRSPHWRVHLTDRGIMVDSGRRPPSEDLLRRVVQLSYRIQRYLRVHANAVPDRSTESESPPPTEHHPEARNERPLRFLFVTLSLLLGSILLLPKLAQFQVCG